MPERAPIPFLQIDSFTREPFGGNPAAVCLLDTEPSAVWMQQVATEMNLSETAFAWPSGDRFGLRWFTPVAEVDLCGHATLATAHALWETKRLAKGEPALFDTRSGRLTASQAGGGIRMDFPAEPAEACDAGDLANALGSEVVWCGQNRMDYLVQLPDATEVRDCAPDLPRSAKLKTQCHHGSTGPPLKSFLFNVGDDAQRIPVYAEQVVRALEHVTSTFIDLSLCGRVAILGPNY